MRIFSSLLCLILPCGVLGQTNWEIMKTPVPAIRNVSAQDTSINGMKTWVVTVTEEWQTTEQGTINNLNTERHIRHQRAKTYSDETIQVKQQLLNVKYVQQQQPNNIAIGASGIIDSFEYRGNYTIIPPQPISLPASYFDSVSIVNNTKKERRRIFFKALQQQNPRKLYFSLGASFVPAIANRHLSITATTSDLYQAYSMRDGAEYAAYGSAVELRLGINFGYRHGILITPFYMRQGFYAEDYTVDFSTGLPHAVPGKWRYAVDYLGVGLGYRYSGKQNKFNPVIELGAYLMWQNHVYEKYDTTNTELNLKKEITGREKTAVGLRVGLGLNYRPGYRFEAFMVPSIYYNVTALHRGRINTTLYNIGLNTGINYYFIRLRR